MDTSANKKIVLDFLAALDTGDGASAMAALADGATWTVAGHGLPVSGTMAKAELFELLAKEADVYEGPVRITPTGTTAEGRRVAVEATAHGAVRRSGKAYNNTYHFLFVVDDGKIQKIKEYMDTHHWAETVGESLC
jgi:ketosteroid isomerase-like protein